MSIRTYLIVVSLILLCALCYGVYVWYVYQTVTHVPVDEIPNIEGDSKSESVSNVIEKQESTVDVAQEKPIVLSAKDLTPKQRSILEAFGMGDAHVVVDDVLMQCLSEALGNDRLMEIKNGSAPSPYEALKIAACL